MTSAEVFTVLFIKLLFSYKNKLNQREKSETKHEAKYLILLQMLKNFDVCWTVHHCDN